MKKFLCIVFIFMIFPCIVGFSAGNSKKVPIIMYHHITKNPKLVNDCTILASDFEQDIKYLFENGYTFILMHDLIEYVYSAKPLNKKSIMITFDDGYVSFYDYVFPILQKYSAKAVLSPIAYWTEFYTNDGYKNVTYTHVTWNNISEMSRSGHVEIQNHTYNMHKASPRRGSLKMVNETPAEYKKNFTNDIMHAQELLKKKCNVVPTTFTYPFGYIEKHSKDYLEEMGFLASISCKYGWSEVKQGDKQSLFELKRINRTHKKSIQNLL